MCLALLKALVWSRIKSLMVYYYGRINLVSKQGSCRVMIAGVPHIGGDVLVKLRIDW